MIHIIEYKEIKDSIYNLDDYIGQEITYKQITDILNIKYHKGGNSIVKQLKEIECYYELAKINRKYKIISKHDEPVQYTDNRQSAYYEPLEIIILYALQKSNKTYNVWSITESLIVANLVNNNYKLAYKNKEVVAASTEIDLEYLNMFCQSIRGRFKDVFESALKRMSNKKLIDYKEVTMIYKRVSSIELNELGSPIVTGNGKLIYRTTKVYKEATPKEREIILRIEKKVLQEMGYSSVSKLIKDGLYNKYINNVEYEVKNKLNIEYYYNAYSIVHLKDEVTKEINLIEREESINHLNVIKMNTLNNSKSKVLNKDLENKELCIDILVNSYTPYNLRIIIKNYLKTIKADYKKQDEEEGVVF